jgi:hypothetical protein
LAASGVDRRNGGTEAIADAIISPTQSSLTTGRQNTTITKILSSSTGNDSMLMRMNALKSILPQLYEIDLKVM